MVLLHRGETDIRNEYATPSWRATSGLPSATIITAGFDPICDEGFTYADRLEEAGVAVELEHYEGMIHGFVNLVDMVDQSRDALETVADGLARSFE